MTGIKPTGNGSQWTDVDRIYDEIDEQYGDNLYLHTIEVDKSVDSPVDIYRYDIVLAAVVDDTQFCVNDSLVSQNLAEYDESTKHHLKKVPNLLENMDLDSSDEDWEKEIDDERENVWPRPNDHGNENGNEMECKQNENEDINFDFENAYVSFQEEDLLQMFPGYLQRRSSSTPNPNPNAALQRIEEGNEIDEDSFENIDPTERQADNGYMSAETDGTDASSEHYDVNHQVEYIYKRPKIDWWQTEEQLILRIGAYDNVQYGLQVTTDYLIYE